MEYYEVSLIKFSAILIHTRWHITRGGGCIYCSKKGTKCNKNIFEKNVFKFLTISFFEPLLSTLLLSGEKQGDSKGFMGISIGNINESRLKNVDKKFFYTTPSSTDKLTYISTHILMSELLT